MDTIKKLLKKEIVRYVIAGGATTVVNIVSFYLLRMFTGLSRSGANVIAISLAILFAFFANKFFVFTESSKKDAVTLSREFISFVGTRLLAMLVEVVGTNLLCDSFRCNEFLSKIIIQFFVVVINYVFGKCFVFKKKKPSIRLFMKKNYIILLAGLLPACFLLGVWIAEKIGPWWTACISTFRFFLIIMISFKMKEVCFIPGISVLEAICCRSLPIILPARSISLWYCSSRSISIL